MLDLKVFKLQRYSSVTLNVSPKNPISGVKKKITSSKIQISPQKNFLSGLVIKQLNLLVFERLS